MLVSLLIPCRNATGWLPGFLPRLAGLHHTIFPAFPEIVFIDDASTDGTPRLLFHWAETAFLPVKVLGLDTHSGLGACLREGVALASGELVAVCLTAESPLESGLLPLIEAVAAGADVASGRAEVPFRTAVLSTAMRVRHRISRDSALAMTSPFAVWRRDALMDSLPAHDGLSAMFEAALRSEENGQRRVAIELPTKPVLSWNGGDWKAAQWIARRPWAPIQGKSKRQ